MNILVLKPSQQHLEFGAFRGGWSLPVTAGKIDDYRQLEDPSADGHSLAARLQAVWRLVAKDSLPEVIALRSLYGGTEFREPTVVTPAVIGRLEKLTPSAPMHIPPLLSLIRHCQCAFPHAAPVLVFETAFFVNLPMREHLYAIDASLAQAPGLRRYGYHGLIHEAAAQQIARQRLKAGIKTPARILSIVLDAHPEMAAILGRRPLMVTSGSTPMEGLPGHTVCGEIDPGIIMTLARKMGWGPEHINSILTRESGLLGLVGEPVTLKGLFKSNKPEYKLAQQLFQYRLLLGCGAGLAALGNLDVLVFSGRFAELGHKLGQWLRSRLDPILRRHRQSLAIEFCLDPLDRLLADHACAAVIRLRANRPGPAGKSILTAV